MNTRGEHSMPVDREGYAIFRQMTAALEIREDSPADRDRKLYEGLRSTLEMGSQKPREFFEMHPETVGVDVVRAFLDVLQPFTEMLDFVFELCSRATGGATGGNDIVIRYDEQSDSLRFDVEAFKRYRRLRVLWRGQIRQARYHSDWVPGYPSVLGYLAGTRDDHWLRNRSDVEPPTWTEVDDLLQRALDVGETHLALLQRFFDRFSSSKPSADEIQAWFAEEGVEGDYLPTSIERVEGWRESITSGLHALSGSIRQDVRKRDPRDISTAIDRLKTILDEISRTLDAVGWRDILEEWLQLPYWKKRWQLYEVWILAKCLHAVLEAGGGFAVSGCEELVLRTGKSKEPVAVLQLGLGWRLELWFEYGINPQAKNHLRPDVVFTLHTGTLRMPILFVECKQHAGSSPTSLLRDGAKYLLHMPSSSMHLLVNYDAFEGSRRDWTVSKQGRTLHAVDTVCPGGAGIRTLDSMLGDLLGTKDVVFLLVDTTGSMHSKLDQLAAHIDTMPLSGRTQLLLVVYGDHEDAYTVQLQADVEDPAVIARELRAAPRTDGKDTEEALEDALHFVRTQLPQVPRGMLQVVVFGDGPAHPIGECPNGYDFAEEVRLLQNAGVQIALVSCGRDPAAIGWAGIPGVTSVSLERHEWAQAGGQAISAPNHRSQRTALRAAAEPER